MVCLAQAYLFTCWSSHLHLESMMPVLFCNRLYILCNPLLLFLSPGLGHTGALFLGILGRLCARHISSLMASSLSFQDDLCLRFLFKGGVRLFPLLLSPCKLTFLFGLAFLLSFLLIVIR